MGQRHPNAVKCLETDIEDLLTFFHVKEDRGVFTNRESVERIVFAVFHHLNVNWENNPLKEFTHKD